MTLFELPPHLPGCWCVQKLHNLPDSARLSLLLLCTAMVEPYLCTFGMDEVERMPGSFCGGATFDFCECSKEKTYRTELQGIPTEWKRNICSHVKSMGRRHRLFGQVLLRLQHPQRSAVLRSWSGVVCVITETECVVVPSDFESRGVVDWARVIWSPAAPRVLIWLLEHSCWQHSHRGWMTTDLVPVGNLQLIPNGHTGGNFEMNWSCCDSLTGLFS